MGYHVRDDETRWSMGDDTQQHTAMPKIKALAIVTEQLASHLKIWTSIEIVGFLDLERL